MKLIDKINSKIKESIKQKDSVKLDTLRSIKSAILIEEKSSKLNKLSDGDEIKILNRLYKQRKESYDIYKSKNREDLANIENLQASIIQEFLPKQLTSEEVEKIIDNIILKLNPEGIKDMGKVMGFATKELLGKADGKLISVIVKNKLNEMTQ
ncbi:MAG: glutamyl-tRNA amidotransferase [Flavobacteriaceae bacterium]|nr:glutamyl-tRNA amidotransferase [Flavobacteriaceae bacterium]